MTTQYQKLSEGNIAFDDTGSGPLIIAVPGMGDLRADYRFLTPQLVSAGYRVVTMDVRGHGETSTGWSDYTVAGVGEDIVRLARSLQAGPAIVIGSSMAAGAAVWAAAEAPDLVQGLVLIGPAVRGEVSWPYRLLLDVLFARPWGPSAWIMYFKSLYPTQKPADFPAYTAALKANLSQPGRLEALHQMMIASKASSEARIHRVTVPTLVMMGSKDPDFKDPRLEAQWVADQLKGSLEMIEGAGHYPHAEMPEISGPKIVAFIKTLQVEGNYAETASQ